MIDFWIFPLSTIWGAYHFTGFSVVFLYMHIAKNAADRNRTGTGITTHGILSPGRLPVPPLRHIHYKWDLQGSNL